MRLTPEQQAELAAGNAIEETGHSFPAPPVPAAEIPNMDAIRKAHAPTDHPLGGEGAPDRLPHRLPYHQRYRPLDYQPPPVPAELNTVEALQRAIVQGLKQGARFSKSDKDSCGSAIVWRSGAFLSSDWGDRPAQESSTEEVDLWRMLRTFSHFERWRAERAGPLSELDTWRLIWSLMGPV